MTSAAVQAQLVEQAPGLTLNLQPSTLNSKMIARVSLEIALRKEFDYAIPPELAAQVDVGTRVQVPFARCEVVIGKPVRVPRDATDTERETLLQQLEAELRAISPD
jgi:primosomal protein N'